MADNAVGADETRVIETNSQSEKTIASLDQTCTLLDAAPSQDSVTPSVEAVAPLTEESIEERVPLEESYNTVNEFETACNITCSIVKDLLPTSDVDNNQLNVTATISPDNSISNIAVALSEERAAEDSCSVDATPPVENSELCPIEVSIPSAFSPVQCTDASLPTISSIEDSKAKESSSVHDLSEPAREDDASSIALSSSNDNDRQSSVLSQTIVNSSVVQAETKEAFEEDSPQPYDCVGSDNKEDNTRPLNKTSIVPEPKVLEVRENVQTNVDSKDSEIRNNILNETRNIVHDSLFGKENPICNETRIIERDPPESVNEKESLAKGAIPLNAFTEEELDRTLTLQEYDLNFAADEEGQYEEFKPQRQSTTLIKREADLEELKSTAQQLTNELLNSKLELADETEKTEQFVSATDESKYASSIGRS